MKSQRLIVLLLSVFCVLTVVHSTASPPTSSSVDPVNPPPPATTKQSAGAEDAIEALRVMMVPDKGEMSNLRLSHFRSVYVLAPCLSWLSMALGWFMAMIGSPNHFFTDLAYVITLVATLNYVQNDTFRIAGFEAINTLLFSSSTMAFVVANRHIKSKKEAIAKLKADTRSPIHIMAQRIAQFVFMFFNVLGVTYYFTTDELFFSLQLHRMILERLTPLTNWAVLLSTVGLYFDSVFSSAFVIEAFVIVAYWGLVATKVLQYPALGHQEMSKLALWNPGFPVCVFDLLLHATPLLFLVITRALNHDNSFGKKVFKDYKTFGALVFLGAYIAMYIFATETGYKGPYLFVERLTRGKGAEMLKVENLSDTKGFGMLMNGLTNIMLSVYEVLFFVFSSIGLLDLSTLVAKSSTYVIEHPNHLVTLNTTYNDLRQAAKKEREARKGKQ